MNLIVGAVICVCLLAGYLAFFWVCFVTDRRRKRRR